MYVLGSFLGFVSVLSRAFLEAVNFGEKEVLLLVMDVSVYEFHDLFVHSWKFYVYESNYYLMALLSLIDFFNSEINVQFWYQN